MMVQTTFVVDETTLAAMEELKGAFGVKTNAQVIRKALALARVVVSKADKKTHTVTIGSSEDGGETRVILTA